MVLYTLEQSWQILRHYFENHGSVAECKIIFFGEPHFGLGGYVNKQNCRTWSTENPHTYIEKPTHPKRVTVCFENEQGEANTVNGDRYRAMLNELLFTKIEKEDIGII